MSAQKLLVARALISLVVLSLAAALSASALAEPITKEQERAAKAHTNAGVKFYNVGKFDKAMEEFQQAYEAVPHPTLLFNMGKAHWRNGAPDKAVFAFRRYLQMAPANDPDRPAVERHIQEISAEIEKTRQARQTAAKQTPPPPVTVAPASPTTEARAGSAPPPSSPVIATAQPVPEVRESLPPPATPEQRRVRFTLTAGISRPFIGVQPAAKGKVQLDAPSLFGIGGSAAYVLALGATALDVGLMASWSPLPYIKMGTRDERLKTNLTSMLASSALRLQATEQITVGPTLAAGVSWWTGLDRGNPFTEGKAAGDVLMPSVRAGASTLWSPGPATSVGFDLGISYSKPTGTVLRDYVADVVRLEASFVLGLAL